MISSKTGFFHSPFRLFLFAAALFSLQGCANFLTLSEREDPNEYDRGYVAENSDDEQGPAGDCSGRHCQADEHSGRSLASVGQRDDRTEFDRRRIRDAIDTRDVVLGMSRTEVLESWGQPSQREVAGRSGSGHERWTYGSRYSLNGSRTVIFENGRVAGWSR
jgi:hypothetical protein